MVIDQINRFGIQDSVKGSAQQILPHNIAGTAVGNTRRTNEAAEAEGPKYDLAAPSIHRTDAHSLADAIKQDAAERIDRIQSGAAPEGMDPDIWSVLTRDERIVFAKTGGLGFLTYGSGSYDTGVSAMPIARGGRLDVRI